jgi:hypothetical protein
MAGLRLAAGVERTMDRCARLFSFVVSASACFAGCDRAGAPIDSAASAAKTAPRSIRIEAEGKVFIEHQFGDLLFRFPESVARPHGQAGWLLPDSLTIFFRWPGLQINPLEKSSGAGMIHLVMGTTAAPLPYLSSESEDLNRVLRAGGYGVARRNQETGLDVYSPEQPSKFAIYTARDKTLLDARGGVVFVRCNPRAENFNAAQCRVDRWLSPRVRYYYTFQDELLKDWPQIDQGIQGFLLSMVVPEQ